MKFSDLKRLDEFCFFNSEVMSFKLKIFLLISINTIFIVQGFAVNTGVIKTKKVSQGIAQLIDHLSEQYHMRFTIVLIGANLQLKDLACEIVSSTKSPVNLKNEIIIDRSNVIDYDEPHIVLVNTTDPFSLFDEFFGTTKLLSYRRKITLIFNVDYDDKDMTADFVAQKSQEWPHDVYLIAHSPENGTMWLMGNELFFNKTCNMFFGPVNMFDSSTMKWQTSKFTNEYRKFHNCTIQRGEYHHLQGFYWNDDKYTTGIMRRKLLKFLLSVFEAFGDKFEINFPPFNNLDDSDYRFEKLTGAIKSLDTKNPENITMQIQNLTEAEIQVRDNILRILYQ